MKKTILLFILILSIGLINAQTKEELLAEKAILTDSIKKLQKEADALQSEVDNLPGWRKWLFQPVVLLLSGHLSNQY